MAHTTIESILNAATIEAIRASASATCEMLEPVALFVRSVALTPARKLTSEQISELKDLLLDPCSWQFAEKRGLPRETAHFLLQSDVGDVCVSVGMSRVAWIVAGTTESRAGFFDPVRARMKELLEGIFPEFASWSRYPMTDDEKRVLDLIRSAFRGVTLGEGVGLRQANGLDEYADSRELAAFRAQDEKNDWSAISFEDLNRYYCSPSYFDAEGMRFHLPAYLTADLQGALTCADILSHLVHSEPLGWSRFEKLNGSQRHAVREFLLLRLFDPNCEFAHPMIEEALRTCWTGPQEP